jgi:hypothetical protein
MAPKITMNEPPRVSCTHTNATRKTRAAVREAALVSRCGKLDEARANLHDLNNFFDAAHQLASVD